MREAGLAAASMGGSFGEGPVALSCVPVRGVAGFWRSGWENFAMNAGVFGTITLSQYEAMLAMLGECIEMCPDDRWDGSGVFRVGTMPFWEVAYHALCFVDCYLSPSNEAFAAELGVRAAAGGAGQFHPAGMKELSEEHPSRRFERDELRRYVVFCRDRAARVLGAETEATLAGPSGFGWLPMTRAELHIYNLRHAAHHTGQLTAFLRRCGVETRWCKAGWREPGAIERGTRGSA